MSDCHRSNGSIYDNFIKNNKLFKEVLNYYYHNGFTYIELGDGDEMWEVKNYKEIINKNLEIFYQLKKFHNQNRLIMIYGNHDIVKKSPKVLRENFYYYYNKNANQKVDLLNNLIVLESLKLNYQNCNIFLIHGHQVDFLNNKLWRLSRLLVRNVWKNLEQLGTKDPTHTAKNYKVTKKVEKKLKEWSIKNNIMLIAGHTHRPIFPQVGQSLYFNDGSCIYPNEITCIEIENGNISLVKWKFKVDINNIISTTRKVLESESIIKFFK